MKKNIAVQGIVCHRSMPQMEENGESGGLLYILVYSLYRDQEEQKVF